MRQPRLAAGLLVIVFACDGDQDPAPPCEVSLAVRVAEPDPLAAADRLQTFIFAGGQAVFGDEVGIPGEGGRVPLTSDGQPKVDLSEDFEVVVAGLQTSAAEVHASGRTPVFACSGDEDVEVPLYIGPANGFATTANSSTARRGATATLLADGRVLVVGGVSLSGAPVSPVVEVYDHRTGTFCSDTCVSGTIPARSQHTATAMADGRVLIVGGRVPQDTTLFSDAYLFDGATGVITEVELGLTITRHAAVALTGEAIPSSKQGKVLIIGGWDDNGSMTGVLLVDVDEETAVEIAQLATARAAHTATLLSTGDILIAGGLLGKGLLASVEIFDATNDTMRADVVTGPCSGGSAAMCSTRMGHSATLLEEDNVLLWGGSGSGTPHAEVWVNEERRFYPATPDAATLAARGYHTATRVPCFRPPCPVLVMGGSDGSNAVDSVMFSSPTGTITVAGDAFAGVVTPLVNGGTVLERAEHAAVALADGSILAVGGRRPDSSAMVFDAAVFSPCEIIVALEGVECPAP